MVLILDVRNDYEFASGHVKGAINIPPDKFMQGKIPAELKNIAKDDQIILYCKTGSRSNVVANIMKDMGFTNIINGINQGHVEKMIE